MTRVLLVTGARSLADRPGAEAWARALIAEALAGVDLLIVGDADGPDAWAWEIARPLPIAQHGYATRGEYAGCVVILDAAGEWSAAPRLVRWNHKGDPHPLRRNAAMVADCSHYATGGDDVLVLALLDGAKVDAPGRRATRGTEHTAGLAERAGLTVDAQTWTPKGATT